MKKFLKAFLILFIFISFSNAVNAAGKYLLITEIYNVPKETMIYNKGNYTFDFTKDDFKIVNKNTKKTVKILKSGSFYEYSFFITDGENLYYLAKNNQSNNILTSYNIKTNQTKTLKEFRDDQNIHLMAIKGDTLYFINIDINKEEYTSFLNTLNLKNGKLTLSVLNGVDNLWLGKNKILYQKWTKHFNQTPIYSVDYNFKNIKEITATIHHFYIYNNSIYVVAQKGENKFEIYTMDENGKKLKTIFTADGYIEYANDKEIVYSISNGDDTIYYSADAKTKKSTKLDSATGMSKMSSFAARFQIIE